MITFVWDVSFFGLYMAIGITLFLLSSNKQVVNSVCEKTFITAIISSIDIKIILFMIIRRALFYSILCNKGNGFL